MSSFVSDSDSLWLHLQPVLVSCVNKHINKELWKPEAFRKTFGLLRNDLINCRTGDVIPDRQMKDFWEGFESIESESCLLLPFLFQCVIIGCAHTCFCYLVFCVCSRREYK